MINKHIVAGALLLGTLGFAGTALAADSPSPNKAMRSANHRMPHVVGSVTSVNGNTIIVAGKSSTYTVDASTAVFTKDGVSSSISVLAVGDKVMVAGTVTGQNVKATKISTGKGNEKRCMDKKVK